MLHNTIRRYSLKRVSLDQAAFDLSRMQWCCCQGFKVVREGKPTLLVLNDATCEDGAQEYAFCHVIRDTADGFDVAQGESVTISWITPERILSEFARWADYPADSATFHVRAEDSSLHHCRLCA